MIIIADHLSELFLQKGYDCRVTSISVWECFSFPPSADLLLQLLPAYKEEEVECPTINIRPFLQDIDDPLTLQKIYFEIEKNSEQCALTPANVLG
jgi:hypothetical protein